MKVLNRFKFHVAADIHAFQHIILTEEQYLVSIIRVREYINQIIPKIVHNILESVKQVECGIFHTCALTETGTIYSFGGNNFGQLGIGNRRSQNIPTEILALKNGEIIKISKRTSQWSNISNRKFIYLRKWSFWGIFNS